jgi:hypothetical protein
MGTKDKPENNLPRTNTLAYLTSGYTEKCFLIKWCHNNQHDDIQDNAIQHIETQHNNKKATQHK